MNILLCIKQVPDMESKSKVNTAGTCYNNADLAWRMNEYDEYAVEQAVQLKEQAQDSDLSGRCPDCCRPQAMYPHINGETAGQLMQTRSDQSGTVPWALASWLSAKYIRYIYFGPAAD